MPGIRSASVMRRLVPAASLLLALAACRGVTREPWELVPLPPGGVEQSTISTAGTVHVDRVRFPSARMKDTRFFVAVVPNGPEPVEAVVVINHGWYDRPEDLLTHLAIDRVYAALLARGAVARAVLVIPDVRVSGAFRRATEHAPANPVSEYIANEVLPRAAARYAVAPNRSRVSVGGFSFGGYIALDVGRRYAGSVGSVSVVSSFYDADWTFWPARPGAPRGDGPASAASDDRVPPRLLLACGTDDRFFGAMSKLHEMFTAADIGHDWKTARGGHTWEYWATMIEPMMEFHIGVGHPPPAGR